MEVGAVVAATPADQLCAARPRLRETRSSCSAAAPVVTACGGATGASKAHDVESLESLTAPKCRRATRRLSASCSVCSARGDACRLIKRCNDFRRRWRVRGGRRAGRRPVRWTSTRCPRSTRVLTAPNWPSSESQERMAVDVRRRRCGRVPRLRQGREPRGRGHCDRDRGSAHDDGVERRRRS